VMKVKLIEGVKLWQIIVISCLTFKDKFLNCFVYFYGLCVLLCFREICGIVVVVFCFFFWGFRMGFCA